MDLIDYIELFQYIKRVLRDVKDGVLLLMTVLLAVAESVFRLLWPRRKKSIAGETALVTGAGHGIGRQYALQLSRLGAKVVCWDIDDESCRRTKEEVEARGGVAWDFVCDVGDRDQVARVAKETRQKVGGPITILVNNAGIMSARPLLKFKPEEVEKIFRVNVFSQFWMLLEFLPHMIDRNHGHVISMSSVAGVLGTPFLSVYCASKFANKGMMEALFLEMRLELPHCKVKFTTVHPFTVNTGLAVNPHTRFPSLIPITEPDDCARQAIDAMLRDEEEVFVPRRMGMVARLAKCLPRAAEVATQEFLDAGVERDEFRRRQPVIPRHPGYSNFRF